MGVSTWRGNEPSSSVATLDKRSTNSSNSRSHRSARWGGAGSPAHTDSVAFSRERSVATAMSSCAAAVRPRRSCGVCSCGSSSQPLRVPTNQLLASVFSRRSRSARPPTRRDESNRPRTPRCFSVRREWPVRVGAALKAAADETPCGPIGDASIRLGTLKKLEGSQGTAASIVPLTYAESPSRIP